MVRKPFVITACLMLTAGCVSQRGGQRGAPSISPPPAPSPTIATPTPTPAAPACPLCLDPASPEIAAAYAAAIEQAKYPTPEKISRDLTPLLRSNDDLTWNDRGEILMVTWTRAKYYADPERFRRGEPFTLYGDTWLMAAPFARNSCRRLGLTGAMLTLRLEQLFGLPPNRGKDAFLEIWGDPTDLFRPCPDPEISDHECLVEVPVVGRDAPRDTAAGPWDCALRRQVSGRYVTVHPGHLRWMCDNWAATYGGEELFDNFPWTALGYTYDWGNPEDPRGPSEYVSPGGSKVTFHSLTPPELYCSAPGDDR